MLQLQGLVFADVSKALSYNINIIGIYGIKPFIYLFASQPRFSSKTIELTVTYI